MNEILMLEEIISKHIASGEFLQALDLCHKADKANPDDPRFMLLQVTCEIELGYFSEAKETALKASRRVTNEPSIYEILGRLLIADGNNDIGSRLVDYAERLAQHRTEFTSENPLENFDTLHELWEIEMPCLTQSPSFNPDYIPIMVSLEIWGEKFVEMFLTYHLTSLTQPDNIPKLVRRGRKVVVALSLPIADFLNIKDDYRLLALRELVDIRISIIKHPDPTLVKYDALKTIQNTKLRKAAVEQFYYCAMSPDAMIADGSLPAAVDALERKNKLAFLCYAPRGEQEAFDAIAMPNRNTEELKSFLADRRRLVKAVMENLHAGEACKNVNSVSFTSWPHCVQRSVSDKGLAVRAFHMHPILIHPTLLQDVSEISITLDNDFIASRNSKFEDTYVCSHSDEQFFFSISSKEDQSVLPPDDGARYSQERIRDWLEQFCSPFNLYLGSFPLRYDWAEYDEPTWAEEETKNNEMYSWLVANTVLPVGK
jgi:hypothetical protein